jgi:hypothetical protein
VSDPTATSAVWYVAYGSNLALDRFRRYLCGGRPAGGLRDYAGCRDRRDPRRVISLQVPGGLVFAGHSHVWRGGMAFLDRTASGRVAGRAYLVSVEQFADVTAQEMRRPPGGEFARALEGVLTEVAPVHVFGPGLYETIVRLGAHDGAPLLTVTHSDVARLPAAAPSAAYVSQIATGLHESHGWGPERIGEYLAGVPGARRAWTATSLAQVARRAA